MTPHKITPLLAFAVLLLAAFLVAPPAAAQSKTRITPDDWYPALNPSIRASLELLKEANSTAEMNALSRQVADMTDAQVYIAYIRLYERLSTKERAALLTEQTKWLKTRTKTAKDGVDSEGGSLAPIEANNAEVTCLRDTAARTPRPVEEDHEQRRRRITDMLALIFFIAFPFLLWKAWQTHQTAKASVAWPTTTGTITKVERFKRLFRWLPRVAYTYSVGEKNYASERISFVAGYRRKEVDEVLSRYTRGANRSRLLSARETDRSRAATRLEQTSDRAHPHARHLLRASRRVKRRAVFPEAGRRNAKIIAAHTAPAIVRRTAPWLQRRWFAARRHDARPLHHQDHRPLRRVRPMPDAFRNHDTLTGPEINRALFQIDQKAPAHDIEKFIFALVMMPVILALHHAEPHDRLVHLAKRLVVPLVLARGDQLRHIDHLQRPVQNVQPRVVRKARR